MSDYEKLSLLWTAAARLDVIRLRAFLEDKNKRAAQGYVLRYRIVGETILLLRIWHSLENR